MDNQTEEDLAAGFVAAQVIQEIARAPPRGAGEDSEGYGPPRPRHRKLQEQNKSVSLFVFDLI